MRARLSADRWRVVIPHLDRALDLTDGERAGWLAALRAEDSTLAADLEALLERHRALEEEGFLSETPAPPAWASLAGQTIGAYTLRSPIGQGGMGSVWLAERSDGRYEGLAAVKLLNASLVGRGGEARFRREGSVLARLRHPHIAHLIDAGVSPLGQPYLVLERVDGERIDRHCDARSLGMEGRIRLFLDVLAAVAHAHANLVVHRDIKPSNVLVTADGQVKLLDFGIAKLLESEAGGEATALTRDGQSALTPEYAAPEQLTGGDVTTATDVYALGVLLYVLLSGRHPAGGEASSPAELIKAIVDTEPVRVSDAVVIKKLRGALRGDLDNIVAKALKKRPSERYLSAEGLAEDLRRYLRHEPVTARADSVAYRTAKFVRRNRTPVALASVALLTLAAGLAGTVTQARRASVQAARADAQARAADVQRDFALRQLSRAEAINDLNDFVLYDAAPPDKRFTVAELLARAERIVERQADEAGEHRAELLVTIGRQYDLQEEKAKALQVLTRAYELAQGSGEPATRAEAACALASAVASAGEGERAEQLLEEAERQLPGEPHFAVHRISCLMRGSEVAQARDDVHTGLARAEAGQRLLGEYHLASALLHFRVSMRLAESYRLAGRHREAAAAFEQAFNRLTALGRTETERAGTVLNNWGMALHAQGLPLRAEHLFRRAVRINSADGTEPASPMLLTNLARSLRDLGRLDEAAALAERAYAKARQLGHEVVINQALILRATIYRLRGDLGRAAAMLSEIAPRIERMVPEGHILFAGLAAEQSYLARARGDAAAALAAADRAVTIAGANPQRSEFLPRFLQVRSEVTFHIGRLDLARADAASALRLYLEAAAPGTFSSHIGHSYLALGRTLQAQGETIEARAAFASALAHLEPSVGPQHPATRSARQLAASTSSARSR